MTAQQRPPLRFVGPDPKDRAVESEAPRLPEKKLTTMEKLERQSQTPIVISMAIVAAIRTMYIFTDRLVDFSRLGVINSWISGITGFLLAIISEITISIAGRRHKLYKALLYQAKQAFAAAKKKDQALWKVEVDRLEEQVSANLWMMRIAMGMSLYAASSYLMESVGTTGAKQADLLAQAGAMLSAVAIAGYVLYLMYFHGVQTDEIKEDQSEQMATQMQEKLNSIRLIAMQKMAEELQSTSLSLSDRLALVTTGLPITAQRMMMPIVRLLFRVPADDEEHFATDGWYSMRDIAVLKGDDIMHGNVDNITRKYRGRCNNRAAEYPNKIRYDSMRGWLVEPTFAIDFFDLPDGVSIQDGNPVVDADQAIAPSIS